MADEKKKGYLLKSGGVFVPTATIKITSPDNQNLIFEVDKVVFNFSEYFTPTVGEKLTFANGNYLECTSVWSNFGKKYKLTLKKSNGATIIDRAYELYKTVSSMPSYGIKEEVTVYPIGNVENSMFNIEVPYVMYSQLEEYKVSTKQGKIWREGNEYFWDPAIVQYLGKEVEVYSKYKGDVSGEGGYGGTFDKTSDTISLPSLPNVSASNCGFVDLFKMSLANTLSLSNFLWTRIDEIGETLRKVLSNPMDAIISLSLTNITLPDGADVDIKLGGFSTGVHGERTVSQFAVVDCGTITVPLYWGTALDYSPNAKAEIYLPCIGTQPINIDDILGKNVQVVYHCDLLSGACIAYILVNGSVMYQYTGNVITQIPLSSSSCLELYKAVISTVGSVATASATGDVVGAASSVTNLMSSKPTIQRGGTISGNTGSLCIKKPYITLIRAEQSLPTNYQEQRGFPCNVYMPFSELHGYSEIESVQLKDISATDMEKDEIMQLLRSGVIF